MSGYLVHSREFNRNQFLVLLAWFHFIHRYSFHSRWSCSNQARVIPALDWHIVLIQLSLYSLYLLFFCSKTRTIINSFFFHYSFIQSSIDSFSPRLSPPTLIPYDHLPMFCTINTIIPTKYTAFLPSLTHSRISSSSSPRLSNKQSKQTRILLHSILQLPHSKPMLDRTIARIANPHRDRPLDPVHRHALPQSPHSLFLRDHSERLVSTFPRFLPPECCDTADSRDFRGPRSACGVARCPAGTCTSARWSPPSRRRPCAAMAMRSDHHSHSPERIGVWCPWPSRRFRNTAKRRLAPRTDLSKM